MLSLVPFALAGTVHFSARGEMVWIDGGHAVVLDPWEQRLVAGGAWSELEKDFGPEAEAPSPCASVMPAKAVVLVERGGACLVRQGDVLKMFRDGVRRWRAEIPSWWGDRHTQAVFDASTAVLYDGRTALQVREDGHVQTWTIDAGHGPIALRGDRVAFSGRPDIVLDLWRQQVVPIGTLAFEDVRWRAGTVVGGNAGHAVVWGADGAVRFVLDEPDYGERRLSPDGSELGVMFIRERVRLGQLRSTTDGSVLAEWDVCGDGHRIWPVGEGRIIDVCAQGLWLRGPDGERELTTIAGLGSVSHVSLTSAGLRVVSGDGSHGVDVWRVPLEGGRATREAWDAVSGTGSREVEGWDGGVKRPLKVEAVHGHPVEQATARAFRKMERAAGESGVRIEVVSGFRTWDEQQTLYDCYLSGDCNGGHLAAPPGFSNHQSGLALDLNTHVPAVRSWLKRNGSVYGFAATVRSEPWHWEYVGGERVPAIAAVLLPPAEPDHLVPRIPWVQPG
ncbi:MAG: M15 family metallopeptidase [Myxococcota bacterium]